MVAAISLIPPEDKKDFSEAYRAAPVVVATESNPIRFLRVESMNPWSAATRLVLYWKYRREVFEDRWLLPLDLSGHGALTDADVANIKKDVVMVQNLPENATLYVDFGKAPDQDDSFGKFFDMIDVRGSRDTSPVESHRSQQSRLLRGCCCKGWGSRESRRLHDPESSSSVLYAQTNEGTCLGNYPESVACEN